MSQISQTTKIMEEQERIKKLVKMLEVKRKGLTEDLNFVDDWRKENNLIFLIRRITTQIIF
jgi:archaellum component FlaC